MQSTCSQSQFHPTTLNTNFADPQRACLVVDESAQQAVSISAGLQPDIDESSATMNVRLALVRSSECTRACRDMVSSAGIAVFSGGIIGMLGLASPQAAGCFVAGSIVAYGIAIHRILALRTRPLKQPRSPRAEGYQGDLPKLQNRVTV
ncbi:MAG: hypothetical protein IT422_18635 [Pirellulaceae bacterium]|nr:hypothetical protein [Pirellulaceae bacterium]